MYSSVCLQCCVIIATLMPQFKSKDDQGCVEYNISSIIADKANQKRKKHYASPLEVNAILTQEAINIAWQFASRGDVYQHDRTGETVYIVPISDVRNILQNGTDFNAVESWYNQKQNYRGYYDPATKFLYEYFTQLVWMSTKEIGCGACYNEKAVYVVCKYEPRGNINSKFQSNTNTAPGSACILSYSPLTILIVIFFI